MKKLILVTVLLCVFGAAAFAGADTVRLLDTDGWKEVDAKEIKIVDIMGRKPGITDNVYVPKEHIPDVRIYSTTVDIYGNYTEYVHTFNYGYVDQRRGKVFGKRDMDLGDADLASVYFFKYECFTDPEKTAGKYRLLSKTDLGDGLSAETYNIISAVQERVKKFAADPGMIIIKNKPIMPLEVVKDGNRVIWASSEIRFVAVYRRGNGYIIIDDDGVGYLSYKGNTLISEYYQKGFTNSGDYVKYERESPILSGRMLTDNIVRIEYKDGTVTHCKVKLTKEDCEKNLKVHKNGTESDKYSPGASLIWHNGQPKKLQSISWDFNSDPRKEPSYK